VVIIVHLTGERPQRRATAKAFDVSMQTQYLIGNSERAENRIAIVSRVIGENCALSSTDEHAN
jgi:hypothetical protein